MSVETPALRPAPVRRVGSLLQTGIIFFPYVFVWLLLRRGYSTRARIIGFGWLLVIALGFVMEKIDKIDDPRSPPAAHASAAHAS